MPGIGSAKDSRAVERSAKTFLIRREQIEDNAPQGLWREI
jgi:cystathionine beta-lyase/cystathionine gamma-synthase